MQKPAREQGRYTQCNLPHARLPQRPLRGFASRPSRFLLSGFNRKGRKEFRKVRKDAVANSPSWLLRCPRSCQNLRAIATGFHQCRSLRVSKGVTLSATSRTPAFLSDLCVASLRDLRGFSCRALTAKGAKNFAKFAKTLSRTRRLGSFGAHGLARTYER